ncbi:nucleotidyltransferase family protein [Abyssalbus ytuae]|uniref:Nucleotidyltransferase family protein n=1 Tax=Abyssalbus ytuae TaxID=2926907 RepID=A0A9E7D1Y7_9FLAO|nr:nucleotidyltransferase family protein [Abyssalbus ytuae]UOB17603.1 nucleotidyltransferase family protein [Abyssalbus ytuae]
MLGEKSVSKLAAIVLAAGESARMGKIKQLLPWGDTTIINNAVLKILKCNVQKVFVVLGAHYTFIQKEINHNSAVILVNKNWKIGIGSSIGRAVNHILESKHNFDGVLITLADQPLIEPSHLAELIYNFNKNPLAVISTNYGLKQGVPAIFPSSYFEKLSLLKEDFGAKEILNSNHTGISVSTDVSRLLDVDNMEDYNKALTLYKPLKA